MNEQLINELIDAARSGNLKAVDSFPKLEFIINKRNEKNETALLVSTENGHNDVVEYLLANGADIKQKGKYGVHALLIAVKKGNLELIRLLLNKGADSKQTNNTGYNAFLEASENGQREVVEFFLDNGEDVNQTAGNSKFFALLVAASCGHRDVVELLLDRGADIDRRHGFGRTSLMVAAENGHIEVVALLLARGAKADLKDLCETASDLATKNNHIDIVKLLDRWVNAEQGTEPVKKEIVQEMVAFAPTPAVDQSPPPNSSFYSNLGSKVYTTPATKRMIITASPELLDEKGSCLRENVAQ